MTIFTKPEPRPAGPPPPKPPNPDPILRAIDEALEGRREPGYNFEAVIKMLVADEPVATPAELKELRRLQSEWKRCWDLGNIGGPDVIRVLWEGQKETLVQRILSAEDISGENTWTFEDFKEEIQGRSTAAREAAKRLSIEAMPICFGILLRLAERVEKVGKLTPAQEYKAAKAIGIEFEPSKLTLILHGLGKRLRERVALGKEGKGYAGNSPKQMLVGAANLD